MGPRDEIPAAVEDGRDAGERAAQPEEELLEPLDDAEGFRGALVREGRDAVGRMTSLEDLATR